MTYARRLLGIASAMTAGFFLFMFADYQKGIFLSMTVLSVLVSLLYIMLEPRS